MTPPARRHYAVFVRGAHVADIALGLDAGPREANDLAFHRWGPGACACYVGTSDVPPTEAQIAELLVQPAIAASPESGPASSRGTRPTSARASMLGGATDVRLPLRPMAD